MSEAQALTSRLNDAVYGKLPNMAAAKALLSEALTALLKAGAQLTSLRASLDDANATISRLSAEKHARDVALRRVIEAAESVREGKNP